MEENQSFTSPLKMTLHNTWLNHTKLCQCQRSVRTVISPSCQGFGGHMKKYADFLFAIFDWKTCTDHVQRFDERINIFFLISEKTENIKSQHIQFIFGYLFMECCTTANMPNMFALLSGRPILTIFAWLLDPSAGTYSAGSSGGKGQLFWCRLKMFCPSTHCEQVHNGMMVHTKDQVVCIEIHLLFSF